MNTRPLSRREFLRGSLLVSGAALAGCRPVSASRGPRVLRVAHITDIHVDSRRRARDGMARALEHIQSQHEELDFIFDTADSIMDALGTPKESVLAHWDIFTTILEENNSLMVYDAVGHNDVWGRGLAGGLGGRRLHEWPRYKAILGLDRSIWLVYNHSFRSQPAKSRLGAAPRAGFALPANTEHAFAFRRTPSVPGE